MIGSRRWGRFEINVKAGSQQDVCRAGDGSNEEAETALQERDSHHAWVTGGGVLKVLSPLGESRLHHSPNSVTLGKSLSFLALVVLMPNSRLVTLKA